MSVFIITELQRLKYKRIDKLKCVKTFSCGKKNSLLPQTKSKKKYYNFAIIPPKVSIILTDSIFYQWALEAEKND